MNETKQFDEAISLALQLTPTERLRLVEVVVASVEREIAPAESPQHSNVHWGERLSALLDSLDLSDWAEIDDPVAWVNQLREAEAKRSQVYWDETE